MFATSSAWALNSSSVSGTVVGMVGEILGAPLPGPGLQFRRPFSIPALVIRSTIWSGVTPPSRCGEFFRNHCRMLGSSDSSDAFSFEGRLMYTSTYSPGSISAISWSLQQSLRTTACLVLVRGCSAASRAAPASLRGSPPPPASGSAG